jgi:hypothetical protein
MDELAPHFLPQNKMGTIPDRIRFALGTAFSTALAGFGTSVFSFFSFISLIWWRKFKKLFYLYLSTLL